MHKNVLHYRAVAAAVGPTGAAGVVIVRKRREAHPPLLESTRSWMNQDRKSTRLNSSHQIISYAVFCLKKKKAPSADDSLRADTFENCDDAVEGIDEDPDPATPDTAHRDALAGSDRHVPSCLEQSPGIC